MALTDNEIISALEVFLKAIRISGEQYIDISAETLAGTLDLINRLQAEKEGLINGQITLQKALAEKNAEVERLNGLLDEWKTQAYKLSDCIYSAKADAIKYALEWLQANFYINHSPERRKQMVKEMVGDTE